MLLRAEYELVPFQSRDELTVLRDWCRQVVAGASTGLAVLTGIGESPGDDDGGACLTLLDPFGNCLRIDERVTSRVV